MSDTAINATESDLGHHCPEKIVVIGQAVQSINLTVFLVNTAEMSNDSRKSIPTQLLDSYYNSNFSLFSEGCYSI